MTRLTKTVVASALMILLAFTLVGCGGGSDSEAKLTAEQAWGVKVKDGAEGFEEDAEAVKWDRVEATEEPNSHQVMAALILDRAGMSSDIESYGSVALVTMKTASGEEVTVVVIDGSETVFP